METTAPRKPGPDVDEEARLLAVSLKEEMDAAGLSMAEVAREAKLFTPSLYNSVRRALNGERTNRPGIAKMRRAFDRLTQRETAEVAP